MNDEDLRYYHVSHIINILSIKLNLKKDGKRTEGVQNKLSIIIVVDL